LPTDRATRATRGKHLAGFGSQVNSVSYVDDKSFHHKYEIRQLKTLNSHMRAYEILTEGYHYVGNCTDQHTAPHLEDMMDAAKRITYRTFVQAVGLDNVREVFRDYAWGHQRNDIRMKNDPYVYYYRSTFEGKPCYYVRHSGIEYIFVQDEDDADAKDKGFIPITPNRFSILGDGAIVTGNMVNQNSPATFWGFKTPTSLKVMTTSAPSKAAALSLTRMIKQSKLEMIQTGDDEDDEESAKEMLKWLAQYL
jgi:hypothetical protein